MKAAITILVAFVAGILLLVLSRFMLRTGDVDQQDIRPTKSLSALSARSGIPSFFVWLDWDANPPSDNVTNYILYMGTSSGSYRARIVLGNQTSVQVIKNHPITYARVTATNQFGESPKSNEVHFTP